MPLAELTAPKTGRLSPLILVYGFAGLIGIGTLLLALPMASKMGQTTSGVDAFFTATSAVCVTGLVVLDTGTYWSSFGQGVILVLIQLGGFGFMTSATLLFMLLRQKVGLRERLLVRESMGGVRLGGLVSLVKKIAVFTIIIETIGTAVFYFHFSSTYPTGTAVWKAIFQSISAFNNAGFDIWGNFQSLLNHQGDVLVILGTAALILLGGISFIVLARVFSARRFSRLSLDSKIVLTTTGALLVLGMIVILFTEFSNPDTLGALPLPQKLLVAFFHSVTPRTAGFSVIDMGKVADYSLLFLMFLMFVGGASGSTAGGIKVGTLGLLVATMWSSIRGKEYPGAFGCEFPNPQIHRALTVVMLSLGLIAIVILLLTVTEGFDFLDLLFETVSAFGTVGLSTGITPGLSTAGRVIIAITMFAGRLGTLTIALSLAQGQHPAIYRYPEDTVRIG